MPEQQLKAFLQAAGVETPLRRLLVGYSGGLDSAVLLHALRKVSPLPLLAVHVHHGLSPNADAWAETARKFCASRQIPLEVMRVQVGAGASVEDAARNARYAAFRDLLQMGDALLLAQQQDDQAETLLFRLCRGAGVHGLGAMQAVTHLALDNGLEIPLWRPLLDFSRTTLEAYARAEGLGWVEDESNTDTRYARNFLRQEIIPALRRHWPEVSRTLAATAQRMQEADGLLGEYALQLVAPLRLSVDACSVGGLLALSAPQRRLALRQLIQERGLPLPAEKILAQIESDVLLAAADATPLISWAGAECRRYRDGLYFLSPQAPIPEGWACEWLGEPLLLPDGRRLSAEHWPWAGQKVVVRFRQGGEKIQPAGHGQHHLLKTLMQDAGIPPWERGRLPLVFVGEELVAVVRWWQGAIAVTVEFDCR